MKYIQFVLKVVYTKFCFLSKNYIFISGVVKTDPNKTFTELVDGRYLRPEWNNNEPVAKVNLDSAANHMTLLTPSTDCSCDTRTGIFGATTYFIDVEIYR